jgi:hypothetical protein
VNKNKPNPRFTIGDTVGINVPEDYADDPDPGPQFREPYRVVNIIGTIKGTVDFKTGEIRIAAPNNFVYHIEGIQSPTEHFEDVPEYQLRAFEVQVEEA